MKILLTGANGFIGKNYLDESNNESIHVISRKPLEHQSVFKNYIGDLTDLAFSKKVIENGFDIIVHCAWQGLPDRNTVNNKINLELNRNFIDLLKNYSGAKNIFIGSCLEYGGLTGTVNEMDSGTNVNDFGKTKLEIFQHILNQNLEFIWLRPFYLYGRYQHPNALMNYLLNKIPTNQEIELQNPNQTHDYLYINDLIHMIKLLETSSITNEIFNVGSGMSVSVTEIANLIKSLFGMEKLLPQTPELALVADIKKAKKLLNWFPQYSLQAGIQEIVSEKKND